MSLVFVLHQNYTWRCLHKSVSTLKYCVHGVCITWGMWVSTISNAVHVYLVYDEVIGKVMISFTMDAWTLLIIWSKLQWLITLQACLHLYNGTTKPEWLSAFEGVVWFRINEKKNMGLWYPRWLHLGIEEGPCWHQEELVLSFSLFETANPHNPKLSNSLSCSQISSDIKLSHSICTCM